MNLSENNFELVPEYTSTRKMTFKGSDNIKSAIKSKYPTLYRWNLENAFEFGYNQSGLLETNNSFATYFIYDSGENEVETQITGSGTATNISFSTDKINIEGEIIRKNENYAFNYSSDNGLYKLEFIGDMSKAFLPTLPLSFYIKFTNPNAVFNNNLKMNAISRGFVIPYEIKIIDNYTLLCKINDYFIHDDKLNYTNYNPLLNKNFLNSFEPILFTNGIVGKDNVLYLNDNNIDIDFHIYSVDGYNNALSKNSDTFGKYNSNETSYNINNTTKLVNNNIVNFSNRNVEKE